MRTGLRRWGPMRSRLRPLMTLLLATLLLALAGCGGSDHSAAARAGSEAGERAKRLTAGTCWDDTQLPAALGDKAFAAWVREHAAGDAGRGESLRDDAAFSNEIPCDEPHSLELYNVVAADPALTAEVTSYADLLDQHSPLYRRIRDQVNDRCLAGSPYGLAQRRAGGLPVQLGPSLNEKSGLHLAWDPFPADLWDKGQRRFVCTFEQDPPGTLAFADLTTSKVPEAARVCLNTPGTYVPCAGKHQAEDLAEMVLNTAIERGQVNGRKAIRKGAQGDYVALSDAEYARLDKVCSTLLASVSTAPGGVTAKAYPGSVSQWPTKAGAYVASCFALKPGEPPPAFVGTVFDRG
jgi:hypothetical protein